MNENEKVTGTHKVTVDLHQVGDRATARHDELWARLRLEHQDGDNAGLEDEALWDVPDGLDLPPRLTPNHRAGRSLRTHMLNWSHWRRRRQAVARHCHYRLRLHSLEGRSGKTAPHTPSANYTPEDASDQAR